MTFGSYPQRRPRRMRQSAFLRDAGAETHLSVKDLIYPVFITGASDGGEPIETMPGQERLGEAKLFHTIEQCLELGIRGVALFPVTDRSQKSTDGAEAWNDQGLVPRRVVGIKERFPEMTVITDVALDPYTSHGQDGILSHDGKILNDETVEALSKQAVVHAAAGADIVAPSDMMDGRVGAIRARLDQSGQSETLILSYSAKYASNLYGPFRDAVTSAEMLAGASKSTYQMDSRNLREALMEVELDLSEGADMVMVKPAGFYGDVIRMIKDRFPCTVAAYQVSGEYTMIEAAAAMGALDHRQVVIEALTCIKRAGADMILSYHAPLAAKWLGR